MRSKRFSEAQISSFIKQYQDGTSVRELAREHGFSPAAFYSWLNDSEDTNKTIKQENKGLKKENEQYKKMIAELMLEKRILEEANEILKKK